MPAGGALPQGMSLAFGCLAAAAPPNNGHDRADSSSRHDRFTGGTDDQLDPLVAGIGREPRQRQPAALGADVGPDHTDKTRGNHGGSHDGCPSVSRHERD